VSAHATLDYAPPKTWQQFEELCADLFQVAWNDPALVRHGRAGQRQHGVDIVAQQGSKYPVGLQCKQSWQWPERKVSKAQVDKEIGEAKKFRPRLQALYILTTAPDDAALQKHVRAINVRHAKEHLFGVAILGWHELVRRVTMHKVVADKHFGLGGGGPMSPLLATWFSDAGKVQISRRELPIAARELAQDFHDYPDGRLVFRQRESDRLLEELQSYAGRQLDLEDRRRRIELRGQLLRMVRIERRIATGVTLMLKEEPLSGYLLEVWNDAEALATAIRMFIEDELDPDLSVVKQNSIQVRLKSPKDPTDSRVFHIPPQAWPEINEIQQERLKKYGRALTDTIDELPPDVRARYAVPAAMRHILRHLDEGKLVQDLRTAGLLSIGHWKVDIG
jgi:hypothetical protein